MNQSSIKPISGVQSSEGSALSKTPAPNQAEIDTQAQLIAARKTKADVKLKDLAAEAGSLADVSIHFRVDDKTNDITVFLVDRKSKKVLRSIPASELQKIQIGDLLKLTA